MVVARDPQSREDVAQSMLDLVRAALTASRSQDDRTSQITTLSTSVDGLTERMRELTRQVRRQDADLQHSKMVAASMFADIQEPERPRKRRSSEMITAGDTDVFRNPSVPLLQAPGDFTTQYPALPAPMPYTHEREGALTYDGWQTHRDQHLFDASQYWQSKQAPGDPSQQQYGQLVVRARQGDQDALDALASMAPDDPRTAGGGSRGDPSQQDDL